MHFNFLSPSPLTVPATTDNMDPQANFTLPPSPSDSSKLRTLPSLLFTLVDHREMNSDLSLANCKDELHSVHQQPHPY